PFAFNEANFPGENRTSRKIRLPDMYSLGHPEPLIRWTLDGIWPLSTRQWCPHQLLPDQQRDVVSSSISLPPVLATAVFIPVRHPTTQDPSVIPRD
ncbi:hypothetical protein TNCT_373491, partial [Trichonephila clavata]